MSVNDILRRCADAGIRLAVANGKLRVTAGEQGDNNDLLMLLRAQRDEVIRALQAVQGARNEAVYRLPADTRARARASAAQRRIYFVEQAGSVSAYNMVGSYRLAGSVDFTALENALDSVVERHEALRTHYELEGGELWQIVGAPKSITWEHVRADARDSHADTEIKRLLERESSWSFDLSTGPIVRASMLHLGPEDSVLFLNVHHIACDGWSVGLILRDLSSAYEALVHGRPAPFRPVAVQYVDFSEWLGGAARSKDVVSRLERQLERLQGMPELHGIPLDYPRPRQAEHRGGRVTRTVPSMEWRAVRDACDGFDVTPFMYLQAAFALLVGTYAFESDVVVGMPVAGRLRSEAYDTVGLFVNTVVLRTRLVGAQSFISILQDTKQAVLDALEDQIVPFDSLVDRLDVARARSHAPVVQIMLAMETQAANDLTLFGVSVTQFVNEAEPSKLDLQVTMVESDYELRIDWHFNASIFDRSSVESMAMQFMDLLRRLPGNEALPPWELARSALSHVASATAKSVTQPRIEDLIGRHVAETPLRIAVRSGASEISYESIDRMASVVGRALREEGVGPGSIVALYVDPSIEMIAAMIAALKVGAAYVPLDSSYPPGRLREIIDDCQPEVLLTKKDLAAALDDIETRRVMCLDEIATSVESGGPLANACDSGDAAYIIYTSGTTGKPKGVVVAHAGLANALDHMDELVAPLSPWSGMLWSSPGFDASVYEIYSVLTRGGTLHIPPASLRLDPEALFRWMDERAVASAFVHAGYLEPYGKHVRRGGGRALRRMMIGAEAIPWAQVSPILEDATNLSIVNAYGPTEATIYCSAWKVDPAASRPGASLPIGLPVQMMTLHVMNMGGYASPSGAVGELYVEGVGVALGYLRRPDLNEEKFGRMHGSSGRRFYRTGDLVRRRSDGIFEFVGRKDQQVKIRGFRIELGDVEAHLLALDFVRTGAVVAYGEREARRLVAYVVLQDDCGIHSHGEAAAFLRKGMLARVPEYMVPSQFVVVQELPVTTNGKIDRARLPEPAAPRSELIAPRDEGEALLLDIWKEVLGVDAVGVTSDFFAVGGQSLLATRVLARIRETLGGAQDGITLGHLLEYRTIEALASFLQPQIEMLLAERRAVAIYASTMMVEGLL